MGQCALTPPNTSSSGTENDFLVVHRSDKQGLCILDHDEVDQVILHQAEEMDKRKRLQSESLRRSSEDLSTSDAMPHTNSILAPPSINSMSAFTTSRTDVSNTTEVTMVVSNLDRYSMTKPKTRSRASPLPVIDQMEDDDDDESTSSSTSTRRERMRARRWKKQIEKATTESKLKTDTQQRPTRSSSNNNSNSGPHSGESDGEVSNFRQKLEQHVAASDYYIGNEDRFSAGRTNTSQGPYQMFLLQCLGPQCSHTTTLSQMESYSTALVFRMEANVIDFYRSTYLKVFPEAATPDCPAADATPLLEAVSSDASSWTNDKSTVDYFAGIPSTPVLLAVDSSAFLDMAVTGSLGLVDKKNGCESPVSLSPNRNNQKSPQHYIVLMNRRSGIPLAVCALKSHKGSPVVRIYATKARVFGQRPAATTEELGIKWCDSLPLYAWSEIVTEGEFPMPMQYSIYMSAGSDGRFEMEPSYRASHESTGSPHINVVGRTESEDTYRGCATLSIKMDDNAECYMALSVSRGIDPALFICFAAITDEVMEKYMREQCDLLHKTEARRNKYRIEGY